MVRKRIIHALRVFFDGSFLIIFSVFLYLGFPIASTPVLTLPQGSINAIIAYLAKNGFDINPVDAYIMRLLGMPQSGMIDISSNLENGMISKGDFLYALSHAKALQPSVTLIPGETMYFFIQELARKLQLDEEDLWAAYNTYAPVSEGVILPNTYKIPLGASADVVMNILVGQSLQAHENLANKSLGHYDKKEWFRIVSMASIIQKEAANTQEMPLVAAVIYNRLKRDMPLQMDGSLNYGAYSHTRITPERIRSDDTPFNTYRFKGIPPTPVGSASIEAIRAALQPADVPYLYFVRNRNGTHSFSTTYKEHKENFNK